MGSEEVSAASVGMWPPIVVSGSGEDGNDQSLESEASELTSSAAGGVVDIDGRTHVWPCLPTDGYCGSVPDRA